MENYNREEIRLVLGLGFIFVYVLDEHMSFLFIGVKHLNVIH